MNDVVQGTVDAVLPLMGVGAAAAGRELAARVGTEVAETVESVARRIGGHLPGGRDDRPAVELAVQAALAHGTITESDLRALVALVERSPDERATNVGQVNAGGNAYVDVSIDTGGGDFHG